MMEDATAWEPILVGERRDQAREAIQAIVLDLGHAPLPDASLAQGIAGRAILEGYLARVHPGEGHDEASARSLAEAMDAVAEVTMGPELYQGFTGIAWAVEHLEGADGAEDANEEVDETLLAYLDRTPWKGPYDVVSGLVGVGIYALERLPRPSAVACLERIVDHLDATATHDPSGTTWWTRPHLLPAARHAEYPEGYVDLGMAHGVAGVIALLGETYAAGISRARSAALLEGAVRWLLARAPEGATGFPAFASSRPQAYEARAAWCYGDPGVAAALLVAGRRAGEPRWIAEAIATAHRARRRPAERAGVVDAGICHGATGLAHMYNRFFHATGDEAFRDGAREWFERALAMRAPGEGIAGFRTWTGETREGQALWKTDASLLGGAAGVALTLLAATSSVEPSWDRMLLLRT